MSKIFEIVDILWIIQNSCNMVDTLIHIQDKDSHDFKENMLIYIFKMITDSGLALTFYN